MTAQTMTSRHELPGMAGFHHGPAYASPASSMHTSPHDAYFRSPVYTNSYNIQSTCNYPSYPTYSYAPPAPYILAPSTSYNPSPVASYHHAAPATYSPASSAPFHSALPASYPSEAQNYASASNSPSGTMLQHTLPSNPYDRAAVVTQTLTPVSTVGSPTHSRVDHFEAARNMLPSMAKHGKKRRHSHDSMKSDRSTSTLPGPIPAKNPVVLMHDQTGVQWIIFEYTRDRVKQEYKIRKDIETVDIDGLDPDFKIANCVYPRANIAGEQYKGNRLDYETQCNTIAWALCHLNPNIRGRRGLIQRAVDSWRNTSDDPKFRSRRVKRQSKIMNKKLRRDSSITPSQPALMQLPPTPQSSSVDVYHCNEVMLPSNHGSFTYMHAPSMVAAAAPGSVAGIQYSI